MKKILIIVLIAAFGAAACSPKRVEGTKLAAGTPAYQLALDLAKTVPALDPEKNAVLVTTKRFTVTVGDAVQVIQNTMGKGAAQLVAAEAGTSKEFVANAARQVADRRLLVAITADAKISLTPEEAAKLLAAQYERAGGEAQFIERIKANDADPEFIKTMFVENETINRYLEKNVFASVSVGDEEIRKAYDQDKTATVRHILLLTQGKPASEIPAIRKKMEGLLVRAKAGEDFAALAKEFTEDPGSKENGGLYENFPRGAMVKPFDEAAFTLPVGQISGIVETEYGFHILKIEGRAKETEPYEKVKDQIADSLKQAKRGEVFEKYMAGVRKKAKRVETKL